MAMGSLGTALLLALLAPEKGALSPPATADGTARAGSGRVTLADIERNLRSLTGTAASTVTKSASTTAAAAAVGGSLLLAAVYLYGRRRGRRRATVLEIRRVS
jgi:trans-2-enoyl-CoA reductase